MTVGVGANINMRTAPIVCGRPPRVSLTGQRWRRRQARPGYREGGTVYTN